MKRLIKMLPAKLSNEVEIISWVRALRDCPLFSEVWYLNAYPDVKSAGVPPLKHYLKLGWKELRNPSSEFDTAYYLTRYPDIASIGMPPLVHYWLHGRHEGRHLNPSLDLEWIATEYKNSGPDAVLMDVDVSSGNDNPYISVIIPTYNRLGMLAEVIAAWKIVDENTKFKYEIIFSDDGSEDQSVEYLKKVQGLPIVVLENEHGGASPARNAAIRIATGERLLIIGDDIFPDAQLLNVHAAKAKELGRKVATLGVVDWAPNLIVNHLMDHITEIGNEQFSYNRLPDESFVDFRHFYTCNICIDRKLVTDNDVIFDDRFDEYGFEDIELGYRLSLKGMKIFYTTAAKGDHYHPYVVEGFCKRQIRSGRMAIVFKDAHPGVGRILGIDVLQKALGEFKFGGVLDNDAMWEQRVQWLVDSCNFLENTILVGGSRAKATIGRYLSFIYSNLFRAMYQLGVLQKLAGKDNVLSVAMSRNFGSEWNLYWHYLSENGSASGALNQAQITEILEAHLLDNAGRFAAARGQRGLYEELAILKKIVDHPAPLSQKSARFQRQATMALYYLVRDPRYLFRRLCQAIRPVSTAPILNITSGSDEAVAPVLALIVDKTLKESQPLIERFQLIFGNAAPIYSVMETNSSSLEAFLASIQGEASFFWPTSLTAFPDRDSLLGAWISLEENNLDVVLISYGLQVDGTVGAKNIRDQMIFSISVAADVIHGRLSEAKVRGKLIRTLPSGGTGPISTLELTSIFGARLNFDHAHCFFSTHGAQSSTTRKKLALPAQERNRPIVFVFPIFVAVGGVERNTVEIIRKLESYYDFVVITMERLRSEQGSLVTQFREAGARVIEMSEVVPHASYMKMLLEFKKWLCPDLIWVCNGSPWFCDNAANIRSLFFDIPIIDQEVYDVNEGWINRYAEPGIQSFDRFIAINQKIKNKFIEVIGIQEDRVDLIYSAIDISRVLEFKRARHTREEILALYELPANKKIFTFVGRLTNQKRPLEFLKIALARLKHDDELYILVGDGELADECTSFMQKHKLKNVIRIPFVSNTLALASVTSGLIITSAYEGLPIAMLEVLNFGVPVFATDTGDIQTVVDEYSAGIVIPIELYGVAREAKYEQWIQRLPEYRASIDSFGPELLARFSSDNISNQYIDCFTKASLSYGESRYA